MSGRLIGPKNSGLKCWKFGTVLGSLGTDYGLLWFWCCWAENGHGLRFHRVEPMLGERASHGQPTAQFGTVKNSHGLLDWTENGPCVL